MYAHDMPAEEICDQHVEVSLLFRADMDRCLTALGPTGAKTHLLREVHHNGPCTHQRLAEAVGVSPRHVTALVDDLESQGRARRRLPTRDRCAVLVELTDQGAALIARLERQRAQGAAALIDGPDADAVQGLRSALDTVPVRLRRLDDEGEAR
jgi:DNA-binding MarR family transcriptional regulator